MFSPPTIKPNPQISPNPIPATPHPPNPPTKKDFEFRSICKIDLNRKSFALRHTSTTTCPTNTALLQHHGAVILHLTLTLLLMPSIVNTGNQMHQEG